VNYLWIRVRDAVAGALDGVTLADLVPQRVVTIQPGQTTTPAIEGALTTS
jgi:DNA-binding IscR family transcriptional regulator